MKRFVPSLLMLANAILAFFLTWDGEKLDETFAAGVLYALLLGLLSLLLALRPRGFVVVLARGVSIAIIISLVIIGLISGAVFALGMGWKAWLEAGVGVALLAIQVYLLRALPSEDSSRTARVLKIVIGTGFAFFLFFTLFFVAEVAVNVAELAMLAPRVRADSVMRASIPRVQACAVRFAKERGGYPRSLADMGPAPRGMGCLDEEHASGTLGRVSLRYVPSEPDSQSAVRSYQVIASGNIGFRHGEARMAFGDESGILRSGDSTASPSTLPVIHGGMLALRTIRACSELRRLRDSSASYPRKWQELFDIRETDSHEQNLRWLGCLHGDPAVYVNFEGTPRMHSAATYSPIGDSAAVTDYVIEIRPRVYGLTGVRSIRATARGPVHTTVEDRGATEQDAIVQPCEYEIGNQTCAPEAGGTPANVDVVLPDTVAHGDTFTVSIVDERPAQENTRPYQYHVLCNYRKFADPPEPPATYSFAPHAACVADSTKSDGGWTVVRVWVRDYATSETSIYRRARLAASQ